MSETARLGDASWLRQPPLGSVLAALDGDGEQARIAGGAVRDALLGLPRGDVDIATTALPQETIRRAKAAGWKPVPTGIDHGTVTVVADGQPFEVTTLRRDVATDGRRATVAFTRDWAEDAARRDLTMNGLFLDRGGVVHDHVGGLAALEAGCVRFIGDPAARIREDYLRILRFFRFHARFARGDLDADGLAASIACRAGLAKLSRERVRSELLKLLVAARAAGTVRVMAEAGLLGPILGGVPRLARFDRLVALDAEASDAVLRLSAVAQFTAEDAARLQSRLRLANGEAKRLAAIGDGTPMLLPADGEAAAKIALYRLGAQAYRDRLRLAQADAGAASDDPGWTVLASLPDRWTPPKPPFAAQDFSARGLASGPGMGRALKLAEATWIAAGFPDNKAVLERLLDEAAAAAL